MSDSPPGKPLQSIPIFWPFRRVFYGWAIVYSSLVVSFFHVAMYGPVVAVFVKPISDELGWSRFEVTLGFTIGSLAGSMLSAVVGGFLDKHGPRGIVMISGVVIAGMILGLASMSEPWHMWAFLGGGRAMAMAGVNLATGVAVANWFVRRRGRAMAIYSIGLRAGQALMPLIILPIMLAYSWRHAYVALAAITLVFLVAPAFMYLRRRPEDLGLSPDGDTAENTEAANAPQTGRWPRKKITDYSFTLRAALRTRAFWLIVVATAGAAFVQTAVNFHAVANFQDKGVDVALAVTVSTIFAGTSAVTMMGWGFFFERIHVRWGAIVASSIQVLAMLILTVADNYPMAVLFAVVYGIGTGGWTVLFSLMFADYFGRMHLGAIRGVAMPVMGIINPLGPVMAAFIYDETGSYEIAFGAFAALFGAVVIALVFASPPRRPAQAPAAEVG